MPVTEFPAVPPTQPLGSCHRHWLRGLGPGTHWCSGLCGGGPVPPSTCQGLGSGSVGPSELPGCLPQRPSLSTPGARAGACRVCAPRLRPCRRLPFTPFDSRILVGEAALSPLESERSLGGGSWGGPELAAGAVHLARGVGVPWAQPSDSATCPASTPAWISAPGRSPGPLLQAPPDGAQHPQLSALLAPPLSGVFSIPTALRVTRYHHSCFRDGEIEAR